MQALISASPFGVKYEGRSFDCGSKIGFLTANVAYALGRDDIAGDFKAEIKNWSSCADATRRPRLFWG